MISEEKLKTILPLSMIAPEAQKIWVFFLEKSLMPRSGPRNLLGFGHFAFLSCHANGFQSHSELFGDFLCLQTRGWNTSFCGLAYSLLQHKCLKENKVKSLNLLSQNFKFFSEICGCLCINNLHVVALPRNTRLKWFAYVKSVNCRYL